MAEIHGGGLRICWILRMRFSTESDSKEKTSKERAGINAESGKGGKLVRDELYLKAKENLSFLRDCILECWDEFSDSRNGHLHFIKDNVIAERVVSRYQIHERENFMNFFYKDVLQLTGEFYGDDPTGGDIEIFFGCKSGSKKQYVYQPQLMNDFLDKEKNEVLFRKECGLPLQENVHSLDGEPFYPKLLIERLKKLSYDCLREYFLCDGAEEDKLKQKKEKYARFVTAVCLYELFVRKFLEEASFGKALERLRDCRASVEQLQSARKSLQEKSEEFKRNRLEGRTEQGDGMQDDLPRLALEMKEKSQALEKEVVAFARMAMLGVQYYDHRGNIAVFLAIISMIEFHNVNNGKDISKYILRIQEDCCLTSALEEEYSGLFMDEISMRKDISTLYVKFMAAAEQEQILQELCSKSQSTREQALGSVKQFFQKVKDGEYADETKAFTEVVNSIARKCIKASGE